MASVGKIVIRQMEVCNSYPIPSIHFPFYWLLNIDYNGPVLTIQVPAMVPLASSIAHCTVRLSNAVIQSSGLINTCLVNSGTTTLWQHDGHNHDHTPNPTPEPTPKPTWDDDGHNHTHPPTKWQHDGHDGCDHDILMLEKNLADAMKELDEAMQKCSKY